VQYACKVGDAHQVRWYLEINGHMKTSHQRLEIPPKGPPEQTYKLQLFDCITFRGRERERARERERGGGREGGREGERGGGREGGREGEWCPVAIKKSQKPCRNTSI
jgi:hypothetical protein